MLNAFTILDMEASGLGEDSYPIEAGFIVAGEPVGLPALSTSTFLINPASVPSWTAWDEVAEDRHQITREELVAGLSPDAAVAILNDRLRGQVVLVDSLPYDSFWLKRLYAAAETTPTFELRAVEDLLRERGGQTAVDAYHRLVEEQDVAHRALPDARQTQAWLRQILGSAVEPAVRCGCHMDLDPGMEPDGCVLDTNQPDDCIRTRNGRITRREDCPEWRPIKMVAERE